MTGTMVVLAVLVELGVIASPGDWGPLGSGPCRVPCTFASVVLQVLAELAVIASSGDWGPLRLGPCPPGFLCCMSFCRMRTFRRMSARGGLVLATMFPAGKSVGSALVLAVWVRIFFAGAW